MISWEILISESSGERGSDPGSLGIKWRFHPQKGVCLRTLHLVDNIASSVWTSDSATNACIFGLIFQVNEYMLCNWIWSDMRSHFYIVVDTNILGVNFFSSLIKSSLNETVNLYRNDGS